MKFILLVTFALLVCGAAAKDKPGAADEFGDEFLDEIEPMLDEYWTSVTDDRKRLAIDVILWEINKTKAEKERILSEFAIAAAKMRVIDQIIERKFKRDGQKFLEQFAYYSYKERSAILDKYFEEIEKRIVSIEV